MNKLVVSQFITMDGVIESPGGDGDFDRGGWAFRFDRGAEGNAVKLDEVRSAGALLLGRRTYEGFAAVWPSMRDDVGFADKMNTMPKYVVSSSLERLGWNNSSLVRGDLVEEVVELKRRTRGDVLVNGSAQLVRSLAESGLVDEYRLMLYPIVLGAGKRLFGDTAEAAALRLAEARPMGHEGVILLTYQPADGK
ncbi:dihydrofolate reductase family protein [Nonomuraea sp. LPB2021202275-12-8]|uniref:dihydrofolate reductase family protein n=1 Tax=Nonomuraea sp. LPB2021202275-12-8 TaxID=3120159 RepID=UPI00300D880E